MSLFRSICYSQAGSSGGGGGGGILVINGNTGSATGATITLTTGASNAEGTSVFTAAVSTVTQTFSDANENTGLGDTTLDSLTSGTNNTAFGSESASTLTTGSNNTTLGFQAGNALGIGSASNILIKNVGATEDNTIRIGTQGAGAGQQNRVFMAGIAGVAPPSPSVVVIDELTGQLGVGAGAGLWEFITASQTLEVNKRYAVTANSVSLLLPVLSTQGDQITVILAGGTDFTLTQGAGQSIRVGISISTVGAGGTVANTSQGDGINIVCTTDDLTWQTYTGPQGNFTVV